MRNLTTRFLAPLAAVAILGGATACDSNNDPGESTQVRVLLTDAPGDIQAAVVTISEVYLQGGAEGRVTLRDDEFTTDLLTLADETEILVDGTDVPSDVYGQLRFVITGAYIQVDNGDGTSSIYATSEDYAGLPAGATVTGVLQAPSLDQSGLKVNLPQEELTLDGGTTTWLVDFDVSQSFGQEAGDQWVMHPVINGAEVTAAGQAHVAISLGDGVALPELGGTVVTLADFSAVMTSGTDAAETRAFTDTDADGSFTADFGTLLPGTYTLTFTGPEGLTFTTDPAAPITVEVTEGGDAMTTVTLVSAVAE